MIIPGPRKCNKRLKVLNIKQKFLAFEKISCLKYKKYFYREIDKQSPLNHPYFCNGKNVRILKILKLLLEIISFNKIFPEKILGFIF